MGTRICPECERHTEDEICSDCGMRTVDERDLVDSEDILIGKLVNGRYRVLRKLGAGGMGAVYVAEQVAMRRLVALKVIQTPPTAPLSARTEMFKRFQREALATSRLEHHNTVRVFDFGMGEDGNLFLAMELLHGKTLTDIMREGPMPAARIVRIALQICRSLSEAHQKGIIHRDLKPDNIMVFDAEGEQDFAKVLDFGIAKLRESEGETTVTQLGSIVGTPAYMAPEQATGAPVVPATDLYALGTILFEALTGYPPYSAPTPLAVLMKHVHDPVPSLVQSGFPPDVPPELERIVLRLLRKDPAERFRSAKELAAALEQASGVVIGTSPGITRRSRPVRATRGGRRRGTVAVVAGGAAGLLILAAIAGYFVLGEQSSNAFARKSPETGTVKIPAKATVKSPATATVKSPATATVKSPATATETTPATIIKKNSETATNKPVAVTTGVQSLVPPAANVRNPVASPVPKPASTPERKSAAGADSGSQPRTASETKAVSKPRPANRRCDRSRCPISGFCLDEKGNKLDGPSFCSDISF